MFKLILKVNNTVDIFRELKTLDWGITDTVPVYIEILFVSFILRGNTLSRKVLLCFFSRAKPLIKTAEKRGVKNLCCLSELNGCKFKPGWAWPTVCAGADPEIFDRRGPESRDNHVFNASQTK